MNMPLSELPPHNREVDAFEIARRLFNRKWLLLGMAFVGFLLGVVYVRATPLVYHTELRVAPAPSSGGAGNRLGGLSGLAALAGVSVGSPSGGISPFDLYLDTMLSRSLAAELAQDPTIMRRIFASQWDKRTQSWHEPQGVVYKARRDFAGLVGLPVSAWHAPGAADLHDYLIRAIVIGRPGPRDPPITRISFDSEDPELAARVLGELHRRADTRIKQSSLATAVSYASYLSQRMRTVVLVEHRRDLSEALGEQEKSIMMASSGAPFAAMVTEPPSTLERPIAPNVVLVLLAGVFSGFLVGVLLTVIDLRALRRRFPVQT